jgi:flagellar basal-body rod protein FlgB
MFGFLTTPVMSASEKAMNCAFQRNARIMDNIANIDTPGHTYSDINFKDYLSGVGRSQGKYSLTLSNTEVGHMTEVCQQPLDPYPSITYRDTSLEKEMAALMETSLFFSASVQLHNQETNLIRTAITQGAK